MHDRTKGKPVCGHLTDFPMPRWLEPERVRVRVHHRLEDMKPGPRKNWKPRRKRKA